ncbi:aspartate aminotransferase family protein [Pseudaeromonas sp. ZJS20]|uniref:aspartate aminotransferase family protein n=1 Tax=Pseudaeromonas aegiceratis TaxID=3153928 RepID=UPI00390C9BBB
MKPILSLNAFDPQQTDALDPHIKGEALRRQRLFGAASVLFYREPLEIARGEGCWLMDVRGERYLDCYNNVPSVGHGHPRVAEAVYQQLKRVNTHTRYLHSLVNDYAERLLATFPASLSNITFTCTGSESNDLALRQAFSFTGRRGVIVTEGAYHGNSDLVTAVSPSSFRRGQPPRWVKTIPAPDPLHVPATQQAEVFDSAVAAAIQALEQEGFGVAALLFDSIFSSDGVYADPAGFIAPAVERVRRHGGLFICDEVQPGFGRTGRMWGFERHGVIPDLVTLGKPMGNGFPLAGVVTRPAILERFCQEVGYFNTFGGSPAAAAAGMAVLDALEQEQLIQRAQQSGDYLRVAITRLQASHGGIGAVRGVGLFTGVELLDEAGQPDESLATAVINGLRDEKVLIGAAGPHANVLKVRPPLCFGTVEADFFVQALAKSLQRLGR